MIGRAGGFSLGSMDIRDGFIGSIGNTPLIKLRRASEATGCDAWLEILPEVMRSTGWPSSPIPTGGISGAEPRVWPSGAGAGARA